MTLCPASGTHAWFAGRPTPPPGAPNEVHLNWAYTELLCDICDTWVPARERLGLVIPEQVLDDHEPARKP